MIKVREDSEEGARARALFRKYGKAGSESAGSFKRKRTTTTGTKLSIYFNACTYTSDLY